MVLRNFWSAALGLAFTTGLLGAQAAPEPPGGPSPDVLRTSAQALQSRLRRWRVELEGGAVWSARNDVAVPGDTGTRFSLLDLTGNGAAGVGRIGVEYDLDERHSLRVVAAPLGVSGDGVLSQATNFEGVTFAAGNARGIYRFDTYRLTYRYRFWHSEAWTWRFGGTLLVRDAEITLEQGALSATKDNLGLVPLLHLGAEWRMGSRWRALLDADALAAPQGRAADVALKLAYDISERARLAFGWRTIEGGADNDEVFSFGWFNAAVVSLTYGF